MRATAVSVIERLETVIDIDAPPQRLRLVIERELIAHFGQPAIQAAENAERLEVNVSRLISEKCVKCEQDGMIPILTVIGSSFDSVAGSCHIRPTDSVDVARAKAHRIQAEPLRARIQSLTFSEFELFGAKVLRLLGAQKTHVTPHSNDQGIDFYGVLNVGQLQNVPAPFFRLTHDVELRLAGQAKHYPTRSIGTSVVRELVGAVSLARHKTFSTDEDLFEELELKPLNPLLVLLFTTGTLSSGAIDLASKLGIIARSGRQLAAFLADCGIGMVSGGTGMVFDKTEFDAWLVAP
ncbi:restriction endonuclease [Noviherbaspirillum sp.]|uniref:restriction endonuclease n=1 Tax=Noviherbaspirillum sp. TaxID=1926288 RepID=UPI002FE24416